MASKKTYGHASFDDIFLYLSDNSMPENLTAKNDKANFKRHCSSYSIADGKLYKTSSLGAKLEVLRTTRERLQVIEQLHSGSTDSREAAALSSHRGREKTRELVAERYYWHTVSEDVRTFVKACGPCQKHDPAVLKVRTLATI